MTIKNNFCAQSEGTLALLTHRRTLNKITPEKFKSSTETLVELIKQIDDEETYTEAVHLVFNKAVSEPNFSKLYAELCVRLNEPAPNVTDKVTF